MNIKVASVVNEIREKELYVNGKVALFKRNGIVYGKILKKAIPA